MCLEGAARAVGDEFVQQIGLARGQQFLHLLGGNGLLQDDLAGFEVATGRRLGGGGHGLAAHVVAAVGKHGCATGRARAQAGLAAEIDDFGVFLAGFVVAKVKFQLELAGVFVADDGQLRGKRPTGLGAKALQRADAPLAQQGFGLVRFKGAPGGRFGEGKAAALARPVGPGAGVAAVVFFDDAAALRAGPDQLVAVALQPLDTQEMTRNSKTC